MANINSHACTKVSEYRHLILFTTIAAAVIHDAISSINPILKMTMLRKVGGFSARVSILRKLSKVQTKFAQIAAPLWSMEIMQNEAPSAKFTDSYTCNLFARVRDFTNNLQ